MPNIGRAARHPERAFRREAELHVEKAPLRSVEHTPDQRTVFQVTDRANLRLFQTVRFGDSRVQNSMPARSFPLYTEFSVCYL